MSEYGFYFDKEKCVGCKACEVACQIWNKENQTVKWRNVTTITKGKYPDLSSVNVSLACMHCKDAPCKKACPRLGISKKKESGSVVGDQKRCIGCTLCVWACPFGAPQLGIHGRMEKCNFCEERPMGMKRACEEICPTQAIITGKIEDLSKIAKGRVAERILHKKTSDVILGHESE